VGTADAQIFSGAPQTCPAVQPLGRELTAVVGRFILDADQPGHGVAQLEILDASGDLPAPGLQGTLELAMTGRRALSVDLADGLTVIGAGTSLTTGSLRFRALAVCPGETSQNGELSGTLIIDDPLLGALRIHGARATSAFTSEGAAPPGTCNGPGSEPVVPYLVDTCDQAGAGCSVAAEANVATFFDESSPGTQTITSELVDFGDGSTPEAIANDASVQHAYAAPGAYTATLSVTDALGTVSSTTTLVVIDP
jgi:hypothetical protein